MRMRFWLGTSGWHYAHWEGRFYPPGLPRERWLEFYARNFPTVEINNTFYRLPEARTFEGWRVGSPPGFLFALKASRFITHIKRLKGAGEALRLFLERARPLGEKMGPLLFQLPPTMKRDPGVLDAFLDLLPEGVQAVVEFRHPSWFHPEAFAVLRRHNAALCLYERGGEQTPVLATADFLYMRFHGSEGTYAGLYGREGLLPWARLLSSLGREVREAYVYFNNDVEGAAIQDALTLRDLLGLPPLTEAS